MMGICQRVAYLLSPISSYSRHIIEAVREGDAGEQAPNVVQAPIFIMHGHRRLGKVGKVKWICIAPIVKRTGMDHSFTRKLHLACLYLVSVHQMALLLTGDSVRLTAAYYSSIDPKG